MSSLLGVCLVAVLTAVHGGNVLLMPSSLYPIHREVFTHLAKELIRRGHEVHWFEYGLKEPTVVLPKGVNEQFLTVNSVDRDLYDLYVHRNHSVYAKQWQQDFWDDAAQTSAWLASVELCNSLLSSKASRAKFDELVKRKFDAVVVDDLYNPCGLIHTGLQKSVFVYWSLTGLRTESAWAHHSPSPPSYIPVPGTGFTDELDFWERSQNLAAYLRSLYIHHRVVLPKIDAISKKHFASSHLPDAFYLERNASINLVNHFPIFDFARPYMPRVNFVGCIQCRKGQPLPKKYTEFLAKANTKEGFIVISSGNSVQWKYAPSEVKENLLDAIRSKPNILFVWQYDGPTISKKPSNLITDKWLPLQDLLADEKCRAHISHGGLNSVLESVWHGIPVIGWPLTISHYDNLLRVTARHAGLMIEKKQPTRNQIISAINRIYVSHYKEEALIFQDMVTDVPFTELNHSAFWVEFIVRHQEVPHARSGADELNILQYFLVDVILFLVGCAVLIVTSIHYTLKFLIRLLVWLVLWPFRRSKATGSKKVNKAKKTN